MHTLKSLLYCILTLIFCTWLITGCTPDRAENHADVSSENNGPEEISSEVLSSAAGEAAPSWSSMQKTGGISLDYAAEFSVDFYDDYSLIIISGTDRYLLIPKNKKCPADLDEDITAIQSPDTIYLAASAGMDYFRVLHSLDKVRMTSTQAVNWSLSEVVSALDANDMLYVGKYSAPDYEILLSEGTDLAIESTMIYHNPDTKEKIEKLGIPVLVDKSSYEKHPLGRMEWIKLYGLLLGKPDEAENFYNNQIDSLMAVPELAAMLENDPKSYNTAEQSTSSGSGKHAEPDRTSKPDNQAESGHSSDQLKDTEQDDKTDSNTLASSPTVAYFYITSSGAANIRRPGDYISRMIELAGGKYAFADVSVSDDSAQATMNMQMEAFLDRALESDILIYSTSIDSEVNTLKDLFGKVPMLKQSCAAETGNIWITGKNMYQQTTAVAQMMLELHSLMTGKSDVSQLEFMHRLR